MGGRGPERAAWAARGLVLAWGQGAGLPMLGVGACMTTWTVLHEGMATFGGWSAGQHGLLARGAVAILVAGLVLTDVGNNGHQAMTLAAPRTVRPPKVAGEGTAQPEIDVRAGRVGAWIAGTGLAILVAAAIATFVHPGAAPGLATLGVGTVLGGALLAMLGVIWGVTTMTMEVDPGRPGRRRQGGEAALDGTAARLGRTGASTRRADVPASTRSGAPGRTRTADEPGFGIRCSIHLSYGG